MKRSSARGGGSCGSSSLGLVVLLARAAGLGDLTVREVRFEWIALGVALVPLSVWVRSFNHGLLLNSHTRLLGPWELYRLTLVGAGIALFLPMGAADLLKARYGLTVHGHAEEMVVSSVYDKLTSLTALAVMGVAGAAATGDVVLAAVAAVIALATLVPFVVPTGGVWRVLLRFLAPRARLDEAVVALHSRPALGLLLKVWVVSFGAWIITYFVVYACCRAVGAPIDVFTVFALAPLSTIARLVPVSAGGVGVGEVTMAALFVRAGVDQALAAQTALLQLGLLILLPGVVGALLLVTGRRPASVPLGR